jgi:heterodisulfide reductase subunit D
MVAGEGRKMKIEYIDLRSLVQLDACTRCGECTKWCPVYDAEGDEKLSPRGKNQLIKKFIRGRYGLFSSLFARKSFDAENIHQCTICGQCKFVCPVELDTPELWENIREAMVEENGVLEAHRPLLTSIKNYDNPWQQPRSARTRWAKKDKLVARDPTKEWVDVLYYVGCTASYDPVISKVAQLTYKILSLAGVNFGILGRDESCCGSTAKRVGELTLFRAQARKNLEIFNQTGAETILTSCAGCFKTIYQDYPRIGKLSPKVMHTIQWVATMLSEKELKINQIKKTITYHDPCHLGRHTGIYDAPRQILSMIGANLVEMDRHGEKSRCCGAGGGVSTAFPDLKSKLAMQRVKDAEETGAEILTTACPFCYQSLLGAVKDMGSKIKVMDLLELVWMSIGSLG